MPNLFIDVEARFAKFQDSLDQIARSGEKTAGQLQKAFSGVNAALGAIGIGISLVGITAFVNKVIEAGDKLDALRTRTGLTGDQLLVLEGAALRGGVGLDAVGDVASKLSRRLQEASRGSGDAANAFAAMGIKVQDAGGGLKSIDTILREVGAKFLTYEDGAGKAALATAALGKGGDTLIPLVEGIKETEERFKRLGITINEDLITGAHKFKDTMEDLHALNQVIARQIVEALLPYLQQLANALVEAKSNSAAFGGAASALLLPIKALVHSFYSAYTVVAGLSDALVGLSNAAAEFSKGNVVRALDELDIAGQKVRERFASAGGVIKKFWRTRSRRQMRRRKRQGAAHRECRTSLGLSLSTRKKTELSKRCAKNWKSLSGRRPTSTRSWSA